VIVLRGDVRDRRQPRGLGLAVPPRARRRRRVLAGRPAVIEMPTLIVIDLREMIEKALR
jgi:hypothetical protein